MSERHPTTQRLISEALRLFTEDGVAGTPIVKIEQAAGLAPGSGAFYKHFRSKAELLDAAIEDAATASRAGVEMFRAIESMSLADQARLIARGTWLVFDTNRDLMLVMARETRGRPSAYTHDPTGWPGDGPAFVRSWLEQRAAAGDIALADPAAMAVVLLDALTFYWMQRETESPEPYGINGNRFIDSWVELITNLAPAKRSRRRG